MKKKLKPIVVRTLQILRQMDYIVYYLFYTITNRIKSNQIVMLSESRESLSGNLKYIDEAIDKERYHVEYNFKKRITTKRTTEEKKKLCKQLATARWILVDDFIPVMYPIPIRKGTEFIQVWHAMGAFKKVGFSRVGKAGGPSKGSLSHKNYTGTIVSAEKIRKNYAEAFGIKEEKVHALGIPRTDVFFDKEYQAKKREELYARYPQMREKKVVLFAPTFRGNGVKTAHYKYEWIDFDEIKKAMGDEYVFLIKMHPFIQNQPESNLWDSFFVDITSEREINDFLFVTDVLVTDYSSVIFEASLLNLPTIFFAPDLEEYVTTRDFYYPYETYTYGPVVRDTTELIEAVMHGKMDETKLNEFKEMFCSGCDGNSAKRFVEYFFEEK